MSEVPPTSVPPRVPRPKPPVVTDSPRLTRLRPDGVEAFWAQVTHDGTPMVERDGADVLITFLWRERRPTRDVLVLANKLADRADLGLSRMRRMPGTDLWHLTYRLPADWQGSYHFAPDESDSPADDTAAHWRQVAQNLVQDPGNPRVLPQEKPPHKSIAAGPVAAAGPHWWQHDPAVPAGRLDTVDLPRRVWRYRPPGWTAGAGPYPLLVLLDGDIWGPLLPVSVTLDNLIAAGRIPPVVALLPDSGDRVTRFTEYACDPGFAKFLSTDLIESAGRELNPDPDPARTVIAGQSLGGLAAAFAALRAPHRFGNVLTQSGAFWWPSTTPDPERLTRSLATGDRLPIRWHVEAGTDEWVALGPNRRLRDALTARGYQLTYAEFAGGHDRLCWRARFGDALAGLLA
ncbi:enterochelin esterase [Actinoplanes sp. RD1]|uniref:enterochelin esterase n=1 Tax=Actinoplanes sp. RD1 TaxID=3064538 RepID=UPI002741FCA9|nr:enterochelin esterase [Actinoplanes sp. RD1]